MSDLVDCYAVIFTNQLSGNAEGYDATKDLMVELSALQPGFLGIKSVREGVEGITVSYWESEEAIAQWKANADHAIAQAEGRSKFYSEFQLQVCRVERAYDFTAG